MSDKTLYFAYAAFLDPNRIGSISPGARFRFTAHFPEMRLDFVESNTFGGVPTLVADPGHTVWGGVFEIPEDEVRALIEAERAEGRSSRPAPKAVDREGNKWDCLTFYATGSPNGNHRPDPDYLDSMIRGARHWSLPAGWVMGLEDFKEDPLFA